nr:unnamed protein product [Callosobruchus analis]
MMKKQSSVRDYPELG